MSAGRESPVLKRKREGAESARKKVKTQRKSLDAVGAEKVDGAVKNAATPKSKSKTQKEAGKVETPHDASTHATPRAKSSTPVATSTKPAEANDNAAEPTPSKKESRRQYKKQRREQRLEDAKSAQAQGQPATPAKPTVSSGKNRKNKSVVPHQADQKKKSGSWALSEPFGGWFLPQGPIFSADEKYLMLATSKALHIYATSTSLLARTLPESGSIAGYALSASNPNNIYIANSVGLITLWNWEEGTKVARWDIASDVQDIAVALEPGSERDLVFCHEKGQKSVLNVHALRTREQGAKTELKQILKSPTPLTRYKLLDGGSIIVATTESSVLVGKRKNTQKTEVQNFEYIWREFSFWGRITALSAYCHDSPEAKKDSMASQLDIAIGDSHGAIFVFENVIEAFTSMEKSRKLGHNGSASLDKLKPRKMHWHREAVGSLDWSRDGNYLISGGNETVLVLWQIATGKKQNLPHLTAAIENIVVSPAGAAYAVTLANNSAMVISTTELEAKCSITGIQSRKINRRNFNRRGQDAYDSARFNGVPLVVDPKNESHVIYAAPSSQPQNGNKDSHGEPYVQTFDITTQHAISRQAMTRNNATDPNIRPDGGQVDEPTVAFVQISHDGQWLATIDEWSPPRKDMAFLDAGDRDLLDEEHTLRREVYLKFWRWNASKSQWQLESRTTSPHFSNGSGATARVLDLVADPSGLGFATVGEDRCVRIWRPKTRLRNGTVVRGAGKSWELVTWSVEHTVEMSSGLGTLVASTAQAPTPSITSRVAFSQDGSLLAVGISSAHGSESSVIHLVDATSGHIRRSITELHIDTLSGIGILGRYLIVVGSAVSVWNLVLDELVYSMDLHIQQNSSSTVCLAIDAEKETFAISRPNFGTLLEKSLTKLSIFNPYKPHAIWNTNIPGIVLSLAALSHGRGFVVLDSMSSLRIISPTAQALQLITPPPEGPSSALTATNTDQVSDMEDDEPTPATLLETEPGDVLLSSENDKPVVRPEQLQQIFESGDKHSVRPVKDLFDAVVGLYARKPRAVGAL